MENKVYKTRACEKCREMMPLEQLKLFPKDKEKNILICGKCREKLSTLSTAGIEPLPPPTYRWYACTRCRYTFKADAAKVGIFYKLHCPYCGRSETLQKVKHALHPQP